MSPDLEWEFSDLWDFQCHGQSRTPAQSWQLCHRTHVKKSGAAEFQECTPTTKKGIKLTCIGNKVFSHLYNLLIQFILKEIPTDGQQNNLLSVELMQLNPTLFPIWISLLCPHLRHLTWMWQLLLRHRSLGAVFWTWFPPWVLEDTHTWMIPVYIYQNLKQK